MRPLGAFLNVRGLYLPDPIGLPGIGFVAAAGLLALLLALALLVWAGAAGAPRAARFAVDGLGLILGVPLAVFALTGAPLTFAMPRLKGFNVEGGLVVQPEFLALLLGLSVYTAAFIAEIVRSGIAGVPKGQKAAAALGLSAAQAMRLVVMPQALRIIIPPLANQYLNLTKNSSLAVAIGYPDLVSVFAGTVLNQTNQALEVILITMAVYLTLSLATSLVMNWFNAQFALVER